MNNKKNIINLRISMIIGLVLYLIIAFLSDTYINNKILPNTIMTIATIIFILFALILFKRELEIGNYECKNCKHLFKPTYKKALFAPHIGFKRYLRCPKCKEKHFNRKRI